MGKSFRIGALISGGGTNLQAIIDACEDGRIDGEMAFVGSDQAGVKGLGRARKHGIPDFVVEYGPIIRSYRQDPAYFTLPDDFNFSEILAKQHLFADGAPEDRVREFFCTRAAAEVRLLAVIKAHSPVDLLVLAGFMRNLTPYFIDRFNTDPVHPRIMNIHPAILPSFPGVDGYGDTFRYGCKVGGCTVHFIDYGEDSGPIIGQRAFPIMETDTLDDVKRKGLEQEWQLYPQCIQNFALGLVQTVKMTHRLDDGQVCQRTVVKIAQKG
ncbi:phosphoribosylglycinamide formyltransferase [Desulfosarcina alkanivorans]|uniref:Phosphoribosylglycinamide formyltransferase n=1 Tax=Desulfosarcina alkanivorans TaxID=571177 RepID=A0A5K7YLN0_9BACT|nr:phosphoribosylglycinamide formyltransferase [Desulfosarcina alkanivorans]BBO69130.1 phosphoribosylglycinamide formyltransferase [Desulfosarcina alkanivorans]